MGLAIGPQRDVLERVYARYNHRQFLDSDPLQFVYRYQDRRDREIVGFLASALAYGRVQQIARSLTELFNRMGSSPYEFTSQFDGRARARLGGFKHRFTTGDDIADLLMRFRRVLDDKINDAVQLRAKVAPVWNSAFSPVLVSREFSTWLRLSPERVYMTPLSAANNQIRLSIGLITGAELVVGPKPAAIPAGALPPVQLYSTFDKNFHIRLVADVFYADLVAALTPVLIDKTFGDDKKVTVKSFSLKGDGDRLMVVLAVTGDFSGELTVLAKPVYHPENNSLTFEDVDFDTRNAGWLITTGSWLFGSTIRNTIKTKLDTAVVEQLEQARRKACAALSSVRLADHVQLTGVVKSLSLGQATVLHDRLSVHVIAQGESRVVLK